MQKRFLYHSIALHVVVFLLCVFDAPFLTGKPEFEEQPPIIVNLDDVKISDVTNIPEKAEHGEERKVATRKEKTSSYSSKETSGKT